MSKAVEKQNTSRPLSSMDEIESYTKRSRAIIKKWISEENFPAVKIDGRWESHTDLIDVFIKDRIAKAMS